jgi:hypothetical protein
VQCNRCVRGYPAIDAVAVYDSGDTHGFELQLVLMIPTVAPKVITGAGR